MKKIGFLSFGHWTPSPHSQTRSAADAHLQSIDLAVAAEDLGADGAYFRVHHFARQLASTMRRPADSTRGRISRRSAALSRGDMRAKGRALPASSARHRSSS